MLIAFGLTAGLSPGTVAHAAAANDVLLPATPLILKDGRIANVSVHVLAFPQGQSTLGASVARTLGALTEEVATDCFLTAQVIGHVGSAEVAGNDTLSAHRLARSRADAVQASLIEGGLPAKAIASVWDWQFMVREPRATLWVFRLTPGEDCEGAPLDGTPPALVAEAEAPGQVATEAAAPPERAPAIRSTAVEPPAATIPDTVTARPAGPAPAPAPATPIVTQALPAASPSTSATATRADAQAPVAVVAALPDRPEPVTETPALAPPAEATAPARPAQVIARVEPAARAAAPPAGPDSLAIVFPTNSSYFPPDASDQLRALLRGLTKDGAYEIVLQSSVSGSQQVVGAENAEEAGRYNQWLAERRLERVREWFDRNATGRELTFKPDYRADDESRHVVVQVRPTG